MGPCSSCTGASFPALVTMAQATARGTLHRPAAARSIRKKRGRRGRDHNLCSLVTPFLGSPCQRQLAEIKQNKHCFDIIVQVCVVCWAHKQKSSVVNTKGKLRHLEVVQLKEPPQKNSVVPWRLKQRGTTWMATSTAWRHCANREKQRDWNCCRSGKSSSRNRRAIMSFFT